MLLQKGFLDLILRNEPEDSDAMDEGRACSPLGPLTPGCSAMLGLASVSMPIFLVLSSVIDTVLVTGIFLAVVLLFGLPLYMRYRMHRAKQARLDASNKSRFTEIPIRSKHPRPHDNTSAECKPCRPAAR